MGQNEDLVGVLCGVGLGFLIVENVVVVVFVGVQLEVGQVGVGVWFGVVLVLDFFVVEDFWQEVFFLFVGVVLDDQWVDYVEVEGGEVWCVCCDVFVGEDEVLGDVLVGVVVFFGLCGCCLVFVCEDFVLFDGFFVGEVVVFVCFGFDVCWYGGVDEVVDFLLESFVFSSESYVYLGCFFWLVRVDICV